MDETPLDAFVTSGAMELRAHRMVPFILIAPYGSLVMDRYKPSPDPPPLTALGLRSIDWMVHCGLFTLPDMDSLAMLAEKPASIQGWLARFGPSRGEIYTPVSDLLAKDIPMGPTIAGIINDIGRRVALLYAPGACFSPLALPGSPEGYAAKDFEPKHEFAHTIEQIQRCMRTSQAVGGMVTVAWQHTDPPGSNRTPLHEWDNRKDNP